MRRGTLEELATGVAERPVKGEMTIVVAGLPAGVGGPAATSLEEARRRVDALVGAGLRRAEAARQVAVETGLPRRAVFGPSDSEPREPA